MTKFSEGQEVEVKGTHGYGRHEHYKEWRKAKIVRERAPTYGVSRPRQFNWEVQFQDGTRAVFDAEHIRAIDSPSRAAAKKVAREFGDALMDRMSDSYRDHPELFD